MQEIAVRRSSGSNQRGRHAQVGVRSSTRSQRSQADLVCSPPCARRSAGLWRSLPSDLGGLAADDGATDRRAILRRARRFTLALAPSSTVSRQMATAGRVNARPESADSSSEIERVRRARRGRARSAESPESRLPRPRDPRSKFEPFYEFAASYGGDRSARSCSSAATRKKSTTGDGIRAGGGVHSSNHGFLRHEVHGRLQSLVLERQQRRCHEIRAAHRDPSLLPRAATTGSASA